MRLKRVLIIIAIIIMSLLAITACDGDNNGTKTIESLTITNGTAITAAYGVDNGV